MLATPKQRAVLDFIVEYQRANNVSPSFEEIAAGLELASISTVHKHIGHLERKGLIRRSHNEARSIEVILKARPFDKALSKEHRRIAELLIGHVPPIQNVNDLIARICPEASAYAARPDRSFADNTRIMTLSKGVVPLAAAKGEPLTWSNWIVFAWATDRSRIVDAREETAWWISYRKKLEAEEKAKTKK